MIHAGKKNDTLVYIKVKTVKRTVQNIERQATG